MLRILRKFGAQLNTSGSSFEGTTGSAAVARSAEIYDEARPATPIVGTKASDGTSVTLESLVKMRDSATYSDLCAYFHNYPLRSLMSDHARAMLFELIRMLRPKVVVEVGTYYAGGAEVMARALWENGKGVIHTTDPFGADRCPAIIANWPRELRDITHFHSQNSMDFFARLHRERLVPDLVLIDGDHDYEPALFDLQMAARLLRPGGVIVMDDSAQTGPFQAARSFLANHHAWRELGAAVASFDENNPFDGARASQPHTGFVLLQAPDHWSIEGIPRSWGQAFVKTPLIDGISLDLAPQVAAGTVFYQAIIRLFGDGAPLEIKSTGAIPLSLSGTARTLTHKLETPLNLAPQSNYSGASYTFEIELCWRADAGSPPLALASVPVPLVASEQ